MGGTHPVNKGCQATSRVPRRFHPQPNGSDSTGKAYDRLAKTSETVNAIQAASPKGTRGYASATKSRPSGISRPETQRVSAAILRCSPGSATRFSTRNPSA